jgi:single-stranded-DNA-specific exonuclease
MHRRWLLQKTNNEYVTYLSKASSISPALAQVLINRGVKTPEDVSDFMFKTQSISDPMEIEGIMPAVEALEKAARDGTRVLIQGDYDVDGLTATAILTDALLRMGVKTDYFIPNRFKNGYGFNPPAVELAGRTGAGIIVTVDCGISSFEATAMAKEKGIGVIITDHHEPVPGRLPDALAIINPKLSNPGLANLAGAGVAFKLVQALGQRQPGKISFNEYFDLAALGTLADSVPLTGENRAIVKEGMPLIKEGVRPGLRALGVISGLNERRQQSSLISFTLVPRINAAGRMSDSQEVVELLLTTDEQKAEQMAENLNRMNTARQKTEENLLEQAMEKIDPAKPGPAIVVSGEGWHEGVVGIVASRIAERYKRPAFVLSVSEGVAKGSARSIPQFDVYAGLTECSDILRDFGGHSQAAGLKLDVANLKTFKERISDVVSSTVSDFTPQLKIEADVSLREINFKLIQELQMLEPFGSGNPEPVLGTRELEVINPRVVGKNHLKMKLKSRSNVVDAIGFGMGEFIGVVEDSPEIDVAYTATINEWEGRRIVQLKLKGLRPQASAYPETGLQ